MEKILCQVDEKCHECEEEMPKGTIGYVDPYGDLLCESCKENAEECGIYDKQD